MSLYDVLGVAPAVDDAALRRAYVSLARRHHPDVVGGDPARMRVINEAWATLGDPIRRARYDRTLLPAAPPSAPATATSTWKTFSDDVDDVDDLEDLEDDRPIRGTVRLPRWLGLLPMGLFALALVTGFFGVLFASQAILGLAFVELILSCLFFLAAPFIALFASRTGDVGRRSQQ